MKKAILTILLASMIPLKVNATEISEPIEVTLTCYLPTGNKTYTGIEPHYGIIAAKKDWIGKTAIVYDENMKLIDVYEIADTGGSKGIKAGRVIDVFVENEKDILPTQNVIIYLLDAEG